MKRGLLDVRESSGGGRCLLLRETSLGRMHHPSAFGTTLPKTLKGSCLGCIPSINACPTMILYSIVNLLCLISYLDTTYDTHTIMLKRLHTLTTEPFHICPWAVSSGLTQLSSVFPPDCIYCSLALWLFLVTSVTTDSHPMALTC